MPELFDNTTLYGPDSKYYLFDLRAPEIRAELACEPVWRAVFAVLETFPQERRRRITHASAALKEARDGVERIVIFLGERDEVASMRVLQSISFDREASLPGTGWI